MSQQAAIAGQIFFVDKIVEGSERRRDFVCRCAAVQRSMQMRMKLTLLATRSAGGNYTKLPRLEIELRPRKHFPVSVRDHPAVESRMKLANVLPEELVRFSVHRAAGIFAALDPFPRAVKLV